MDYMNSFLNIFVTLLLLQMIRCDSQISCTFENGLCAWSYNTSSNFRWRLNAGPTGDRISGPLMDHTCKSNFGQYLYVAGGNAEKNNSRASIETEVINLSKSSDFSFWYLMNGFGTGSLTLYRIETDISTIHWSRSSRQGKDWMQGNVTLTPGSFKLRFEVTVLLPIGSDIAIDDIRLGAESHGTAMDNCLVHTTAMTETTALSPTSTKVTDAPPTSTPASSPKSTEKIVHTTEKYSGSTASSTCESIPNPTKLPGSCDFEEDTCGIEIVQNDSDAQVTWFRTNRRHGKVPSQSILGDHTFLDEPGRGFYMDFSAGSGVFFFNPQTTSRFETPELSGSPVCLTFWYTMPHQYSNLKIFTVDAYNTVQEVWNIDNPEKFSGWRQADISISVPNAPYKIMFESFNKYFMAMVGVDDIVILGQANSTNGQVTKPNFSLGNWITRDESTDNWSSKTVQATTVSSSLVYLSRTTKKASKTSQTAIPTSARTAKPTPTMSQTQSTSSESIQPQTASNFSDLPVSTTQLSFSETMSSTSSVNTQTILSTTLQITDTTTFAPSASASSTFESALSYTSGGITWTNALLSTTLSSKEMTGISSSNEVETSLETLSTSLPNKTTTTLSPPSRITTELLSSSSESPLSTITNDYSSFSSHSTVFNALSLSSSSPIAVTKKPNSSTKKPNKDDIGKVEKHVQTANKAAKITGITVGCVMAVILVVVIIHLVQKCTETRKTTTRQDSYRQETEEQMQEIDNNVFDLSRDYNQYSNGLDKYCDRKKFQNRTCIDFYIHNDNGELKTQITKL